jgi:hypothetical protein
VRKCGNDGCKNDSTSVFVLDLGGRQQILFSCDGCKRYLGPEELPLTIRSDEVVGADEAWALAMSVMEDHEVPDRWAPGLRTYVHPLLGKG